jgi:broad specificity phosphatase PhoE
MRFASYDRDADIAWFPTGESDGVVSERVADGLRDYDRTSRQLVAIEV